MSIIDRILGRRVIRGDMTGGDVVGRNYSGMGSVTINNQTFTGSVITMTGGRIIVDGKDVTDQTGVDTSKILEIKVTGDIESVTAEKSLTVIGTIKGNVDARGAVNCDNIEGDVKAGGSVNADDIGGSVYANGSVNCDDVGGSVQAGGSVNRA